LRRAFVIAFWRDEYLHLLISNQWMQTWLVEILGERLWMCASSSFVPRGANIGRLQATFIFARRLVHREGVHGMCGHNAAQVALRRLNN
jgi:hypothetical protein